MYSINKEYKNKIILRCVLYKTDCSGTAYIEFGKFLKNEEHNHPKSFAEIEKRKIEARIKNHSEKSNLAPRDIYNKNINHENVDICTFTKISSIMRERWANILPPIHRIVEEFDNLLKYPDFGTIDGNIFYTTVSFANDEFALNFLADSDLSFLNRIHSIHVDATFLTVSVDFYQLLIIHWLFLDTIIPKFFVLRSGETCLLYDAVFLKIRPLAPQFKPETIWKWRAPYDFWRPPRLLWNRLRWRWDRLCKSCACELEKISFLCEAMWAVDVRILYWKRQMSAMPLKKWIKTCNIFSALSHHNLFYAQLFFRVSSLLPDSVEVFLSLLAFQILFS